MLFPAITRSDHLRQFFELNWKTDGGSGLDVNGFLSCIGSKSLGEVSLDVVELLVEWQREQRQEESRQIKAASAPK